jgi:2-methylcitrate dehydratase
MSSLARTINRGALRSLRQTSCVRRGFVPVVSAERIRTPQLTSQVLSTALFSTMSSLKSSAAIDTGAREYDSEINDMASYVHNYKINSDLAVS